MSITEPRPRGRSASALLQPSGLPCRARVDPSATDCAPTGVDEKDFTRRGLLAAATLAGAAAVPLFPAAVSAASEGSTGTTARLGLPFPQAGEPVGSTDVRALAERVDEIALGVTEQPVTAPFTTITRWAGSEGHGPFAWSVGSNEFGGQINPLMHIGYNAKVAGSAIDPNEPTAFYSVEADYVEGPKRTVEMYAQIESAPTDGSDGVSVRPFFFQAQRDAKTHDALLTRATVAGNPFQVEHTDGTPLASFHKGRATISASPGETTVLDVRAADGQASQLRLGAAGTGHVVILGTEAQYANVCNLTVSGSRVARFYSTPIGVSGASVAVGTDDSSAVGLFAVGESHVNMRALVARGRGSQQGNLFEAQGEDGIALVSVTPAGSLLVRGSFDHSGNRIGLLGATPVARRGPYVVRNPNALRTLDVTSSGVEEVRRVLGVLINDLQAYGLLGQ